MTAAASPARPPLRDFAIALARAFGGALVFGLPILMTQEMWHLGFVMQPWRLALFVALMFPVLAVLAYYAGFEATVRLKDCVLSACVAYAVGFAAAALGLLLFNQLTLGDSPDKVIGMVAIQAVPAAIGAMLARSQLGQQSEERTEEVRRDSYGGEVFLAGIGALFLAFNIAPTEEILLLASTMTVWHALVLCLVSLLMMHGFVYAVEFRGQTTMPEGVSGWSEFLRLTVVAYALALLVAYYVLWTFGRCDGIAFGEQLIRVVVLGWPAALGAAAARLIL